MKKLVCTLCGQDWDGCGDVCPNCHLESDVIEVSTEKPIGKSPLQTVVEQQSTSASGSAPGQELTLEILDEAISKLPKERYPKRLRINPSDYSKFRESCDAFHIFPIDPKQTFTFCMGMKIVPDVSLKEYEYKFDF